jgi:hypothetical protein
MRIIFIGAFIFTTGISVAQFVPVPSTIKTPYGNVQSTTYHYMPMNYYNVGQASVKYAFTVVLQSDSVFTAKARIDVSKKQHVLPVKTREGKRDIFPGNTKQIYRETSTGKKIVGMPADSCWLFKSVTGKINAYSHLAEVGYSYIIAIQDGDRAPILPFTRKNFEAMIGTADKKVLKLIEKGKLLKALQAYDEVN